MTEYFHLFFGLLEDSQLIDVRGITDLTVACQVIFQMYSSQRVCFFVTMTLSERKRRDHV